MSNPPDAVLVAPTTTPEPRDMTAQDYPQPRYRGRPASIGTLEKLGREQLSRQFFMHNFPYSEVGAFEGIRNIPEDPALAIQAGRGLSAGTVQASHHGKPGDDEERSGPAEAGHRRMIGLTKRTTTKADVRSKSSKVFSW